jgi:hypothetical protein
MQILIDIPDSISTEKIDQIIAMIKHQLKNESASIRVEKSNLEKSLLIVLRLSGSIYLIENLYMTDRAFIDTNIWVYSHLKQKR